MVCSRRSPPPISARLPYLLVVAATFGIGCACFGLGCASALPWVGGAHAAPVRRAELVLGGAARVTGRTLTEPAVAAPTAPTESATGGVVPVVALRYGLADGLDVGLLASGTLLRAEGRYSFDLGKAWTLNLGLGPYGGYTAADETRFGLDLPITFGWDQTVLELWFGARLGAERSILAADGQPTLGSSALKAAGVIGLGAGFRHLHVLFELGVGYEAWQHDAAEGPNVARDGIVLTPAFVLRYRI